MNISLWIIIVNYRTAGMVENCLRTLEAELAQLDKVRVIVADNHSGDGSVEHLRILLQRENWSWAEVLPLPENGGFAYGNNRCMSEILGRGAPCDYFLLLNPDTLVIPGAVSALLNFMRAHPEAGIAGSQLVNADGSNDLSAHDFPSPLHELEGAARLGLLSGLMRTRGAERSSGGQPLQVDWVSGASMLVRRKVLEDIGQMDEKYFLYFEEVDFCRRAVNAGWQCWHVPASRIVHLEGAATGIRQVNRRRSAYWYDSRRRYFTKHFGITGLLLADFLWISGRLSFLLRRLLRLGAHRQVDATPEKFMLDLLWGDARALLTGSLWQIRRGGQLT